MMGTVTATTREAETTRIWFAHSLAGCPPLVSCHEDRGTEVPSKPAVLQVCLVGLNCHCRIAFFDIIMLP